MLETKGVLTGRINAKQEIKGVLTAVINREEDLSVELTEQANLITNQEVTIDGIIETLENKIAGTDLSTELNEQNTLINNQDGTIDEIKETLENKLISADISAELSEQNTLLSTQEITIDDIRTALETKGTGGIDTTDATATSDDILLGKTAYVNDEKIEGTIETWDGTIDGEYKLYNALNDYLTGSKTKITKEDLAGLTELRVYAFAYSPITEVEFPDKLVRLGDRAFYQTKITSVNLEGITYIGQYTFSYVPIKELVLPASIKNYGQRCFESCTELETVRIESQAGLPPHCFQYDTKLKRVICLLETPPNIYADQFKQFKGGETIEVRADKIETYKSATNWSNYADYIIAYEED